jgi:hypothetical protein
MKRSKLVINEKFMQDFREYNKLMRRCRSKEKTLEEYIRYRRGIQRYQPTSYSSSTIVAARGPSHRELYPSYGDLVGTIPAKQENRYTGTKIKGVAVMHKSNLVPITSQEQAEDVAKMRRN